MIHWLRLKDGFLLFFMHILDTSSIFFVIFYHFPTRSTTWKNVETNYRLFAFAARLNNAAFSPRTYILRTEISVVVALYWCIFDFFSAFWRFLPMLTTHHKTWIAVSSNEKPGTERSSINYVLCHVIHSVDSCKLSRFQFTSSSKLTWFVFWLCIWFTWQLIS